MPTSDYLVTSVALHTDDILSAIVQCIAAPHEVSVFLDTVPGCARSKALIALDELLHAEALPVDALWPQLCLDAISLDAVDRVRDAMPAFPSVAADNLLAARPAGFDPLDWLQFWSSKITRYTHIDDAADVLRLCSILRQCTKLQVVDMPDAIDGACILEAIMTPAHRVSSFLVDCTRNVTELTATVARWLTTRHATHLDLTYASSDRDADYAALAAILIMTTELERLTLSLDAPGLLAPLVGVAPLFTRLRTLDISVHASDIPTLRSLLERLCSTPLRSLRLDCNHGDISALLDVLSTLPALDDLELSRCCFDPTRLRPLFPRTLPRLHFSDMAWTDYAWSVLGVALASAHGLNELSWHSCRSSTTTSLMAAMAATIPHWIERGAKSISFHECGQDVGARELAAALPRTTSSLGVDLVISGVRLSTTSYILFGMSLAMCAGVSIVLPRNNSDEFRAEAKSRRFKYREVVVDGRRRLVFESSSAA
ncbi:hypothetical protein SPRG_11130 [Saprolegnia parasitica CBS 223.65]|uniref:Uncharacterized protein n=1 Tax=Saprolegnia parasitica (strain CBS 223.65) TaxID=695850 RepID=A0A067CA82_SAPPC|nr:hypothetical protein SPRG_11130 [Saprolegnia parasitica CBS 223.65]KDO23682.1 hypothetical protein SPRG_11130 [Saprolegnia parasitica CBS 223.65]|eukprot:XP_012205665.1 hypothetical protein SPRG_11130 [Saprolegnia parasitica CBS 223.65]